MSLVGSVRIPLAQRRRLRIRGIYPKDIHVAAGNPGSLLLRVYVGEALAVEQWLVHGGAFTVDADIDPIPGETTAVISLIPGQFLIPFEAGINNDRRELSLWIKSIQVDDQVVVDFAHYDSPYRAHVRSRTAEQGVNLAGHFDSRTGVGESARLALATAQRVSLPCTVHEVCCEPEQAKGATKLAGESLFGVNLIHTNAETVVFARRLLGEDFWAGRYNIGYWHWELEEFPDVWAEAFGHLDEIWAPSRFVCETVAAKSPIPVVRIPHAIEFPVPKGPSRGAWGLPEDRFVFLMMYDLRSFQDRKNPQAVVEAYRRAFASGNDAALVIKTNHAEEHPDDVRELEEAVAGLPGVTLLHRPLSRDGMYELESLCDGFVALHRSEGFGLGFAECMYMAKPVIGTNYSGNVDFMNANNSCPVDYTLVPIRRDSGPYRVGNLWAEPDVDHAAWYMKKLVSEPAYARKIGRAGRETMRTDYSRERIGGLYRRRLDAIARHHA
jgi:glycosyltransferase involved in cell wall biosynthesis